MVKKVLLDLDTGIDDALALCYVLGSPQLELIGVTAAFGNVSQSQSLTNALALLHLLGRDDIPVYPGASGPLDTADPYEPDRSTQAIHGLFGLGPHRLEPPSRPAEKTIASQAINQLSKRWGNALAIVATGPLTNLALALQEDPEALPQAGDLSIMGGAFFAAGNVTPYAEVNIANDPLAAKKVLSGSWICSWNQSHPKSPITAVGLDVTMKTTLSRSQAAQWLNYGDRGSFLSSVTNYYIDAYQRNNPGMDGCALHDPLAAARLDHPDLLEGSLFEIAVTQTGDNRGQTLPLRHTDAVTNNCLPADKRLLVSMKVNAPKATDLIISSIERCLNSCQR